MSFKRRLVASCLMAALIALAIGPASAQRGREVNKEMLKKELTGIKVGEKAPAFKLKDQNGEEVELKALLKKSELTALVFYRSADW